MDTGERVRPDKLVLTKKPARAAKLIPADVSESISLGVLKDVIGFRLRRIQVHLARTFANDPRHRDLTPGLVSILALIAANPGVSQGRLGQEAAVDKNAMVPLIDRLEDLGWAYRVSARDDRRKRLLHVTPQGGQALAAYIAAVCDLESNLRAALSPIELEQLIDMLDRLYAACVQVGGTLA